MAYDIFNKIDEEYFSTILDETFSFKGTIKFDTSCLIKGYIEGRIESKDKLVIGPNSLINANIKAKSLECFGKINGDVTVDEEVYFHSPSILNGSLKTDLLTFEKGCVLNGKVEMTVPAEDDDKKESSKDSFKNRKK